MSTDDYRVLQVFIGHLAKAIEQKHLREIALAADSLERADELRTAILRSVSHDLRSPLASIKASVSTLRQTDVTWSEGTQQEFLSSIESETDRLTSIVTNLLDLSRLESGAMQPAIRAVSLEEVVPSVVHYFEANHKNLNLELPADIEDVAADPALLERVISNLLDNAFKWAPSQSTVTIRAHQSGNYAQIHFIDHGPGISQEHKQVVRQPFHRVGDKSQNGGLGLGLAIADRLVESMNGRLELRDTPGGGLTSVVLLPIYRRFIA
jgi:two-component system sensor histidine kinase KdpD